MREFEHKRKMRKVLSSPVLLVPFGILFLLLARGTWNIYLKDRASVSDLEFSEERLAKLQARQTTLTAAVENLSTEAGIEAEIRDRLQMAKPGERQIVIVEDTSKQDQTTTVPRNFLQKMWDFFTK